MKPEKEKTWQEIAELLALKQFLALLDVQIEKLQQAINEIYPELGRQSYRHRETKERPWAVEQYLSDIATKDAEIQRISDLRNSVIDEIKKMAVSA